MRPTAIVMAAMVTGGFLAATAPANATAYTFTPLQVPGVPTMPTSYPTNVGYPYGINNLGQVVGTYSNGSLYFDMHGYLYKNGTYTTIDAYGAAYVSANGINDLGQVVGTYAGPYPNYGALQHAYLDTNGVFQKLDKPGASATQPNAINNAGEIVGNYSTSIGYGSYFYKNGVFTDINPFGQSLFTSATGINNLGEIIGNANLNQQASGSFGYLDDNGVFTKIQVPLPNIGTRISGINDVGQIVGYYYGGDFGDIHGFIYQNGVYSYLDLPKLATPSGINNSGQIIVELNGNPLSGILATPTAVAEPASLALFGFGVAGLALARSRANGQATPRRPTLKPCA